MKSIFGLFGSIACMFGVLAMASGTGAADAPKTAGKPVACYAANENVDITIYGARLAQVQETRTVTLVSGTNKIQLNGIATGYIPDSLYIVSTTGPGTFKKRMATYQGANLTNERMLADSVGKEVEVFDKTSGAGQWVKGKLLSVSGSQLSLELTGGEVRLLSSSEVRFARPSGLSNTAALVVEANVSVAGDYKITFMYETNGLNWEAKHRIVYDDEKSQIDHWETTVSVTNNAGVNFSNATVRLMPASALGETNNFRGLRSAGFAAPQAHDQAESAVISETVGDYKAFVLNGATDLINGQSCQVTLLEARDIPVTRQYFVPKGADVVKQEAVSVRLFVDNSEKANLGKDLPAGLVKVFQRNAAGIQLQTGGSFISDKAENEKFDMVIGTARDVKYTRTLVENKTFNDQGQELVNTTVTPLRPSAPGRSTPGSTGRAQPAPATPAPADEVARVDSTWRVKVFNYKTNRKVHVKVEVALPQDQQVEKPLIRKDARSAEANLTVPASGDANVEYTISRRVK